MNVTVTLTKGEAALGRLEDAAFVAEWERLQANCPWATSFQSFAFVDCWYRLYDELYEPVIIEGRDDDGSLVGLLTLARRRNGRLLVGAGDIHAEYQGWISEEAAARSFIVNALPLLEWSFPRGRLHLNFLPPRTPLTWAEGESRWPRRIRLRRLATGLIDLSDQGRIGASLRKGHNRSRLNSLRRFGDVRLETIDTVEGLEREMDEIAVLCDLRQGAIHDSLPFVNDPPKRSLHLGLMERGLLHVTVLRVGHAIASVHLDMKNGAEVLIYLIAHAPAFARYSPGSLHILMLAEQLAGQGFVRYDLSPGGGYKDRYTTDWGPVDRMTVLFGFTDRVVNDLSSRVKVTILAGLSTLGIDPDDALLKVRRLRTLAANPLVRRPSIHSTPDCVVLRMPSISNRVASAPLELDRLADLLAYSPSAPTELPMREFLQVALHRLEAGHRVLTRKEGPLLEECWWLCRLDRPSGDRATSGRRGLPMASHVLLYGRSSRGEPDTQIDIVDRLRSAASGIAPAAACYVAVAAGDFALIDAFVNAGSTRLGEVNQGPGAHGATVQPAYDLAASLAPVLAEASKQLVGAWPNAEGR